MSVRLRHRYLLAGAVALLLTAGCAPDSDETDNENTGGATGDAIIIGVAYDSSGPASATSVPTFKAINAAVDEINKKGGVDGRPFKIVSESDGGQATNAPVVVESLIKQGAVAILMASASPSFLQVKPIIEESKIPAFSPINANETITQQPNATYTYAQAPTTSVFNAGAADALANLGVKRVAIVADSAPANQLDLPVAEQALKAKGLELVDTVTVKVTSTDTSADMARLRSKNPEGVFIKTQGGPVQTAIYNGLHQAMPDVKKVITFNCADPESKTAPPEALDGTICMSTVTLDNPRTKEAHAVLEKALGSDFAANELNSVVYQGYQAPFTLAEAVKLGGGADSAAIQTGFEKIADLPTYWGSPDFTVTYTPDNHKGGDFQCTYSFLEFEGNDASKLWSAFQPSCG